MECEIGYIPTVLEKPAPDFELAQCMRWYHSISRCSWRAKRADCRKGGDRLHLSGHDRAAPTVAFSSTTFSNASTLGSGRATFDHVRMSALVTATGYGVASTNLALGAEI